MISKWPAEDFMTQWSASIPGSVDAAEESLLTGIAKKKIIGINVYYLYEPL